MWFKLNGDQYLTERCATENCHQGPTWRLEVDGYGSIYCVACKEKIERQHSDEIMKTFDPSWADD